jgi:hypothetical protein
MINIEKYEIDEKKLKAYFLSLVALFENGISQQYILIILMLFKISVNKETLSSIFFECLLLFNIFYALFYV